MCRIADVVERMLTLASSGGSVIDWWSFLTVSVPPTW
jgi:hypothetical protein